MTARQVKREQKRRRRHEKVMRAVVDDPIRSAPPHFFGLSPLEYFLLMEYGITLDELQEDA
jgi:hypothetical protein